MSALEVTIAEAVKTLLAAGDFGTPVTVTREYLPIAVLAEGAQGAFIKVVPATRSWTPQDRSWSVQDDTVIHIGIQSRLGSDPAEDPADTDALLSLAEKVMERLVALPIQVGEAGIRPIELQRLFIFDPKHLAEHRQFTTVVAVTYRGLMAIQT